jgi:hypothetical protein
MSTSQMLGALVATTVAVGVVTALAYRSAAGGGLAILGSVLLLVLALGVAWASSTRRANRR